MFYDPRITDCYVYKHPTDCRKGHNGLMQLVVSVLKKELCSGAIFLFVSKDRKTAKAIKWEGTGLMMFHKKMERGKIMPFSSTESTLQITPEQLMSILSGAKVRLDLKF